MVRKHVIVSGLVQGVFFRDTCRRKARAHDVRGWVRNLPDGTVEAVFEGDPQAVENLLAWARRGPAAGRVDDMAVTDQQPEDLTEFTVR
ncbi:acylphosphatase [Streptomyces sp. SM12]|uniref:acylphosphatase n=1 Tax=Streptomyces sp. SM12 TaxID=1071602 RepID=UPI0015E17A9C|nr:acylphosphatase [Streptomyces sp. SM12]